MGKTYTVTLAGREITAPPYEVTDVLLAQKAAEHLLNSEGDVTINVIITDPDTGVDEELTLTQADRDTTKINVELTPAGTEAVSVAKIS